jgi:AraC-like DNA-binding protein
VTNLRPPLCRMSEDPEAIAREIENYLLAHAPKHDAISLKAREIVELAENDRAIVSVSRLAQALRLSVRSVQAICQGALGVSPKWLIRCFRLQDALARLGVGSDANLSVLAPELGYFDQAHFTRDLRDRREPWPLLTRGCALLQAAQALSIVA